MTNSPGYNVLLIIALIVAVIFSLLIFFTSKGDAMSGGSSVRTSFRGRDTYDDKISRFTFMLGAGFIVLMLVLDVMSKQVETLNVPAPVPTNSGGQAPAGGGALPDPARPNANAPASNAPAANAPATNPIPSGQNPAGIPTPGSNAPK